LDFWVNKPIAHGRLGRIVRWTPEMAGATRPVGSRIAGLSEDAVTDDVETLRSGRQGEATTLLEHIFGSQVFQFPKPLSLIRALVRACSGDGDTVLDFFAGSGTTARAVLAQNAEDEADRRFIMVSNTEATDEEVGPQDRTAATIPRDRARRDGEIQGFAVGKEKWLVLFSRKMDITCAN
jgi:adenine-specific DNA-methyltransferase